MLDFNRLAFKTAGAVLVFTSAALASGTPDWYPASVEKWAKEVSGANQVCQLGYKQSPTDLPGCNDTTRPTRPSINLTWATQSVTLTNNGHTVQIEPQGGVTGKMTTDVAGVVKTYTLAQCHFHWGSEHVIDGVQQVMELHCVHTEDDASPPHWGVLGIFYELGNTTNTFLSQFEDELPTHTEALAGRLLSEESEHDLLGNPVDQTSWRRLAVTVNTSTYTGPTNFLEAVSGIDLKQYWNYDGSFTTPPCTEIVDWYNLMGKATLTQAQLDKFKYAQGWSSAGGNFRNAQPLRGRTIYGCEELPVPKVMNPWYPYNVDHWAYQTNGANRVCKHGTFQSPIDFEKCAIPTKRDPIGLTWATQTVKLINNAHTVQVTAGIGGAAAGKMTVGKKTYSLLQCHWHWGSEHRVGGLQTPLEVHCVHQLDSNDVTPSYGVFGVFYELSDKENAFLKNFEDQLPSAPATRRLDEAEEQVHGLNLFGHPIVNGSKGRRLASGVTTSSYTGPLDFQALWAGVDKSKFWDYQGSFTTPPCTEAVDFYIMMDRAPVTMAQLNKFKAAIGWDTATASGNFRPPQPLNGRAVSGCDSIAMPQHLQTSVIVDEESCGSVAALVTLQVITGVCVLLIFVVVVIAASKKLTGGGGSSSKGGEAIVYGASSGSSTGKDVSFAKLQEDLQALMSGNVSVMQAKSEENAKTVTNTVQLATEIKENMQANEKGDMHPALTR